MAAIRIGFGIGLGLGRGRGGAKVPDQTATFGALTAANAVGFRPLNVRNAEVRLSGTPRLISGSLGAYTPRIVGGRLTFSGAAGAPDGAVLQCSLASGGKVRLTISAIPNAYTVGSNAEFKAFLNLPIATKSGKTCIVRVPDDKNGYGMTNADWSGKFLNPVNTVYIRGEKPSLLPIVGTGGIFTTPNSGGVAQGKVDITYLAFYYQNLMESKLTGDFNTNGVDTFTIGVNPNDASEVRFAYNYVFSNCTPARLTGMRPKYRSDGVKLYGTNCIVENNIFENIVCGVEIYGDNNFVRNNIVRNFWDDPFRIVGSNGGNPTNNEVAGNRCYNAIGDHGYHPDFLHMFHNGGSPSITNNRIHGNMFAPGNEGVLAPSWPVRKDSSGAYNREAFLTVGDRALTAADAQKFIFIDARNTPSAITLPALSGVGSTNNSPDYLLQSWFNASAGITVTPASGDLLFDADNQQYVSSASFISLPWDTVIVWHQTTPTNRWAFQRAGPVYQGVFTNAVPGALGDISIAFNILWIIENGFRDADGDGNPWSVVNNSLLPPWYNLGTRGGFYDPTGKDRFILSDAKTTDKAAGNICGIVTKFVGDNATSAELDLNNSWNAIKSVFNVVNPNLTRWAPDADPLDAIALARPKAIGVLPTGTGALSVDPANDHWNYGQFLAEPLGKRRNTPWEVIRLTVTPTSGGVIANWKEPGFLGDGPITSYDCQYRVNGGAWTAATVSGTQAIIGGMSKTNVASVRVRANNANGAGVWATVPDVTVVENAAGPVPTMTSLIASPSVATVGAQLESASFAVSGTKPVIVVIPVRTSSTTSAPVFTATIGNAGRAAGTGTPMTLIVQQSATARNMHAVAFIAEGLSAASGQTIQLTCRDSSNAAYNMNGVAFHTYELTGARTTGSVGATANFTINPGTSLSTPLTTGSINSLIVGGLCIGASTTASVTNYDSILQQQAPNGATQAVSASRATTNPATFTQSFSWATSAQAAAIVFEIRAAAVA